MKLVIDEKLKHRLVGVAVILSLGAIFLPAMMKKSSQRLENSFSVNVQLPPKPKAPNVVITDEKEVFKSIKVAKVTLPSPVKEHSFDKADFIPSVQISDKQAIPVAKVEPKPDSDADAITKPIELALSNAVKNTVKKEVNIKVYKPVRPIAKAKIKTIKKQVLAKASQGSLNKKATYAVQLASFSKLTNAQALVNKLRAKGYKANFIKIAGKQGPIYKVYAGHSPVKNDVMKLKIHLASAMQLNGFVVNTGVS